MTATQNVLHVVCATGSERLALLQKSGGGCEVLVKNANPEKIARYLAENHPLMYGEANITSDCCANCDEYKCFKKSRYAPITPAELEEIIDLAYHIQEGDGDLIMDAVSEEDLRG